MFPFFLIVAVLVALAVTGLSVGVLLKGKFPDTHVGHNAEMKKRGITCAKNDVRSREKRGQKNLIK